MGVMKSGITRMGSCSLQRVIREEWEALQQKEKEAEEKREEVRREKEVKFPLVHPTFHLLPSNQWPHILQSVA